MKLLSLVCLALMLNQSLTKNIFEAFESLTSKGYQRWEKLSTTIKSVINTTESRQSGFNEIVFADFTTQHDASKVIKSFNQDQNFVLNAVFNKTGPFDGKTPEYLIVLLDEIPKVEFNFLHGKLIF